MTPELDSHEIAGHSERMYTNVHIVYLSPLFKASSTLLSTDDA